MIKINNLNKTNDVGGSKNIKKSSENVSFSDYLSNISLAKKQQINSSSGISVTDAIFAAQMVNDEEKREIRKKLIKRGFNLIEKLEEIRDSLLLGEISKEKLIEISRLIKENNPDTEDAKLLEIITEIELRVEVELAKLTR